MNFEFKRYPLYHECIVASFPYHKQIKDQLLFLISKSPSRFLDDGLLTDWKMENSELPQYFQFFEQFATVFYQEIFTKVFKLDNISKINISSWFQQYTQNSYHSTHFHGSSDYSSVYFLDLPNKDPTVFYNQYHNTYQTVDAKEGDIIIFPSIHLHTSLPSNQKTVIAMNFRLEV